MSNMFSKQERRFQIGLRSETFAHFEAEADALEMSVGQYISWKLEEIACAARDAATAAGED